MPDLIGVVHLPLLRATPNTLDLDQIINYAIKETKKLVDAGFDGVIIENFGDTPFVKSRVSDTVIAKLSIICHRVQSENLPIKLGLNILRNASVQAIDLATTTGFDFVRSNIWESAYVTDQGIIEGVAHDVMKRKRELQSQVEVFADIMVKHATPLSDFTLLEAAEQALGRGGADQIIISGRATGDPISIEDLEELNSYNIYPLIGSGGTIASLSVFSGKISGLIVGTAIKSQDVMSPIDATKATAFADSWKTMM